MLNQSLRRVVERGGGALGVLRVLVIGAEDESGRVV